MWHDLEGLRYEAPKERSTRIGAALIVVAAVAAWILFNQQQLIEYIGRGAIIFPVAIGALGVLGVFKRDKPKDGEG